MSVGLPPLGGLDRGPTRPAAPPELLAETAVAQRVADDLRASGRELRFELDSDTGKIRCEVRDLAGNVLRRVPLDEMLDSAAGGRLP